MGLLGLEESVKERNVKGLDQKRMREGGTEGGKEEEEVERDPS